MATTIKTLIKNEDSRKNYLLDNFILPIKLIVQT